jgi:hypothetical protein
MVLQELLTGDTAKQTTKEGICESNISAMVFASMDEEIKLSPGNVHSVSGYMAKSTVWSHRYIQMT